MNDPLDPREPGDQPEPAPATPAPSPTAPEPAGAPLLARGNRLRLARGGLIALAGGFVAFAIMASDAQARWGVPLGVLAVFVAAFGVLDLLGSFDDPDETVATRVRLSDLAAPLAATLGALGATLALIGATASGALPIAAAAALVPAAFLAFVAATFHLGVRLGPLALDERGEGRPLARRHGFWVVAVGTLLYLPMQGSYSLSDPWEAHYGEVAREMLSRNDWISTWWAQDGWFWSKPVLDFWMQALAMGIFGVHWKPDQMLAGAEAGHTPWPEWAVRMPVFVLTVLALYVLYKGVARVFGRRAGLLGALVLATMPQWFLLAHQTITDMPLVATLSTSMGLLMLGMHTPEEQRARSYEVEIGAARVRLTAFHLVFFVIIASALPQILYLASRNFELFWGSAGHGFHPHLDEFWSGSRGNCGLPGNEACNHQVPSNAQFQPGLQALMWSAVLGLVLWLNWGERRLTRLYYLAAWYFAAVATMGKGPAGFGLPICVTFTYLATTRKWRKLLTVEIVSGLLIIAAVAIPWYFAMYVRHGQAFTDRLIFHDMYKRAMTHVHDTNEGDDVSFRFYVWQLGYALFPWTGLVPAGLVWWTRRRDDAGEGRGDVSVFLAMWFVFAFGLFTAMLTKFHHYIFPSVPPAAMLTGIVLDRMLGDGALARPRELGKYLAGLGLGTALSLYGFIRLFPGSVLGTRPEGGLLRPGAPLLGVACIVVGLALAWATARRHGVATAPPPAGDDDESRTARHEDLMLGGVGVAAAVVVALVGRDLASRGEGGEVPGQARLMHLFTYNYRRAWPESLEFGGTLTGFAIVATALTLLLVLPRLRRHLVVMLLATGLVWAAWGLDVYLVKCAPHWGQREVIEAYYKARKGPAEPVVAYQMNWKGENFYTGNRIPAFVSSGTAFTTWVKQQQEAGVRTFFFVTEHGRTGSLKNELGSPRSFETLTDKRVDNKFTLVRASFE